MLLQSGRKFLKDVDDIVPACEEKYKGVEMQSNDCCIGAIVRANQYLNTYFQLGNNFRRDLTIKQKLIEKQSSACYKNLERNFNFLTGELGDRTRELFIQLDRCINHK